LDLQQRLAKLRGRTTTLDERRRAARPHPHGQVTTSARATQVSTGRSSGA